MKLALGIDFGGTSIKFGVTKGTEIIATAPPLLPPEYDCPTSLIDAISETALQLKESHPEIAAIGCGVPGFVDFPTGTIHNLTNVKGWTNIHLKAELEKRTSLPCSIENDANAMAIAEWKLGAAKGSEHAICLTLGTGVGGGIIVNNQMVRGANFTAGELGQTSIDYQGIKGAYNNPGALEAYNGNNELAAEALQAYKNAGISKELTDCTPAHLAEAANNGCEIALKCWDTFAQRLACTLATTCWLLNPEIIVIGGGVSKAGEVLFEPLNKHLSNQLSGPFKDDLKIVSAQFGNEAGILGCAALALENA